MKLSEAILEGCKRYPRQEYKRLYYEDAACVVGAALAGINKATASYTLATARMAQMWPDFMERNLVPCPGCGIPASTYSLLVHLNDSHRWSRENIAQWLKDTVEGAQEAQEREEELVLA